MDDSHQQNTNPQQPQEQTGLSHKKTIQPSETFVQEMQAPQSVQTSVAARDFKPPTEQSGSGKESIFNQSIPPVPTVPTPFGVSASQLGLNAPGKTLGWRRYIKKVLIVFAVLIAVVGGYLFFTNFFSGMTTKTLSNGGYNYSFKFYRSVKPAHLQDGSNAFNHSDNLIASVIPTKDTLQDLCAEIPGSVPWTQAFTVQVYNSTRPVCTEDNVTFEMGFMAQEHNHWFLIYYHEPQNPSAYHTLRTIFSSVKVSQ